MNALLADLGLGLTEKRPEIPDILLADIGLGLRDHLECRLLQRFTRTLAGDLVETGEKIEVVFIDVSNPAAPVLHLDTGDVVRVQLSIFSGFAGA